MTIRFALLVAPRTKKTSNRVVRFGRHKEHIKILPSEAFEEFFKQAMGQAGLIRNALHQRGVTLPIEGRVSVRALFYRQALTGDATGYYQALADALQEPQWREGKLTRDGLGIICDDKQIEHWDGSRLLKDAIKPRIEIEITELEPKL